MSSRGQWLVACEESGVVREALRRRGHEAVSCDLMPSALPGPHLQCDVRELDLSTYYGIIAFPPCTYITVSGNRYHAGTQRREEALELVRLFLDAPCERVAVENPVGVISSRIRKPDQIIQPWQFGHAESKTTCLWLRGLWPLVPTDVLDPPFYGCCDERFPFELGKYGCPNCHGERAARPVWLNQTPSGQNRLGPSATRARDRARTYPGIAAAMAEQWAAS